MTGSHPATSATSRPRRVVAVVNPVARVGAAAVRAALEQARPPAASLRIVETTEPRAAVHAAREAAEDADLVVAVGGDGTVADVASGLLETDVPVGIVPAGSTNIVARELGIPSGIRAAARLLFARHRIVRRDAGLSGGRCFLHMAGAGFDAHLFDRADPNLKRKVGWLAYLPAAADALREPPVRFAIEADAARLDVESPLVLIANGSSVIHPLLRLNPVIRPDDGWLDLLVFTATTPAAIARTLSEFATGRLAGSPDLIALRAKRVRLSADPPVPIQFDGDVIGVTPIAVDLAPLAVGFAVPVR